MYKYIYIYIFLLRNKLKRPLDSLRVPSDENENNSKKVNGVSLVVTYNPAFKNLS